MRTGFLETCGEILIVKPLMDTALITLVLVYIGIARVREMTLGYKFDISTLDKHRLQEPYL